MTTNNFSSKFATPKDKIIVALDGLTSFDDFKATVQKLAPLVGWFKIGTESMLQWGAPPLIDFIKEAGAKVFCDLKLNDIPETCKKTAIKFAGVDMINIHCSSGEEAMKAVLSAVGPETIVIGVTVLTSIDDDRCVHIFGSSVKSKVMNFANDAKHAGLHGVVCSATDLKDLRLYPWFENMLRITPGIQPDWMPRNDQKRVMTPYEAIKAGATALVIGRAIIAPPKELPTQGNSKIATRLIIEEIYQAMDEIGLMPSAH